MRKGFTLIELLIVIAIIGILSSVVLVKLTGGKEKAQWNKYASYVSQVTKLTKAAMAGGYFDSIGDASGVPNGCLGLYAGDNCWGASYLKNNVINNALSNVGTVPIGESYPGSTNDYGTIIRVYSTYAFVYAYLGSVANMDKYCDDFGWNSVYRNDTYFYCYTRIYKNQ